MTENGTVKAARRGVARHRRRLGLICLYALLLAPAGYAQSDAAQAPPAVVVTADEDGFQLRSADGRFALQIRGDVAMDGRFQLGDADHLVTNTFYLRRARPTFQGTMLSRFDFKIMADVGEGSALLQDAYLDLRFAPSLGLRAGQFKTPMGLERLQPASSLAFPEQSLLTNLVPNRDVGLLLHGLLLGETLSYDLGVLNGVPDGRSQGLDVDDGKELVARLFAHPFQHRRGVLWKGLGIGLGFTLGQERGEAAVPSLPAYRTPARAAFFRYRLGTDPEATTYADGRHLRLSPQAYYHAGPFGLMGEYARSIQAVRRAEAATDLAHEAWQLTASWLLTGEQATYGRVRPSHPFGEGGGWGAFEATARVHALHVDEEAFPVYADPEKAAAGARAWGVGGSWYLNANVRLMLSYEQTRFEAAAGGPRLQTEKLLLSRFQLVY